MFFLLKGADMSDFFLHCVVDIHEFLYKLVPVHVGIFAADFEHIMYYYRDVHLKTFILSRLNFVSEA